MARWAAISRKSWRKALASIIVVAIVAGLKTASMFIGVQVVEGYQVEVRSASTDVTVTLRKPGEVRSGSPAASARLSSAGSASDQTSWAIPQEEKHGVTPHAPTWSPTLQASGATAKEQQVVVEF